MSKRKEFNLEDYKTGNYSVETINGRTVDIVHIDEARGAIFGFYDGVPTYWEKDGSFFPDGIEKTDNDLVLRAKRVVMHINVVRRHGKLDVYGSTLGKPKVYSGGELVKYITVEVDE